ncbi:hypothetical protein D3C84_458240 [compost metagenome]
MGRQRTVAEGALGHVDQGLLGNAVLVQVALGLQGEELGGQHQAGFAVPVLQAPVRRLRVEGAARVLVEADRHADLGHATAQRGNHAGQGAAAGGAAVGHVDERDAGQPEVVGQRVGIAAILAATVGHTDLMPLDSCVLEGLAHGIGALGLAAQAVGAPEGVQADTDDGDIFHHASPSAASGAKAKVCRGSPAALRP